MNVMNGLTSIVTIGSIVTGMPLALTWKLADISQLFSLFYFSGSPNFRSNQDLFRSLRYDNLAPIIPNPIAESHSKIVSGVSYIYVEF